MSRVHLDSGAGKTETTKILLQYFATKGKKRKNKEAGVEHKVPFALVVLLSFRMFIDEGAWLYAHP